MAAGCPVKHHGVAKALGCRHAGFGSFGFLFDPPLEKLEFSDELLGLLGSPNRLMHDERGDSADAPIPAGYTFFAQFVDHDVTLDTQSDLNRTGQDATSVKNLRTPSLDLDCVYGTGPEAQPHLYDSTREGFLLTGAAAGRPWDLGRSPTGAALIGDPRNDENLFVGQMQLLWIRFHNALMLANMGSGRSPAERFESVQTMVRHHYQYVVLYDFLARVCHPETYEHAVKLIEQAAEQRLSQLQSGETPGLPEAYPIFFRHSDHAGSMPMPVEFSVAAYRFGHTTVRSVYPANSAELDIELFDERFGTTGFSSLPEELAVDWRFQLEVDAAIDPVNVKGMDHLLPDELMAMPDPIVGRTSPDNRSLAFRNLARARSLGLPSGESVAQKLAEEYSTVRVLPADEIFDPSAFPGRAELADAAKSAAGGKTPLFFYLMREAAIEAKCATLGPAGSAILLEVFGRMLVGCNTSFFFRTERDKDGTENYVGGFEPIEDIGGDEDDRPKHPRWKAQKHHFTARRLRHCEKLKAPSPRREPPAFELADVVRYTEEIERRMRSPER
jgi:hypothetical protein